MASASPGILHSLSKLSEMYFVYAFFFDYKDEVFIKVGQSVVPYKRLDQITQGCPFHLTQAVFTQIGGPSPARSFEARMKIHLKDFRTRGEWYCFKKDQGKVFNETVNNVYKRVSSRRLEWSKVDLKSYFEKNSEESGKWLYGQQARSA